MGILSRYLLARYAASFAAILGILVLAVAAVEMLADLDEVLAASRGARDAAAYLGLRVAAYYLPILIPLASCIGAFAALGTAARGLEILAMKAGGISPLRAAAPVLAAAAVVAGVAYVSNDTLSVRAHESWRRRVRGEQAELSFRQGSFWHHKGSYVFNVRDADPARRALEDVAVYELDERGRLVRMIEARRAEVSGERWRLFDAAIRRFDPDAATAASPYARVPETELELPDDPVLLEAGVAGLSIGELREYRDQRRPGDPEQARAQALIHQRLTAPFTAFVFALVAAPLGLRVEETRSLARPALWGLLQLAAFLIAREYASTLATQAVLPPAATPWAILAALAGAGAWQLARVPR